MSRADLAFVLGLYASFVASAAALWTLFRDLWLERARIQVRAKEAWLVKTTKGRLTVKSEAVLAGMGVRPEQCAVASPLVVYEPVEVFSAAAVEREP